MAAVPSVAAIASAVMGRTRRERAENVMFMATNPFDGFRPERRAGVCRD
jgi:hypothetical protein